MSQAGEQKLARTGWVANAQGEHPNIFGDLYKTIGPDFINKGSKPWTSYKDMGLWIGKLNDTFGKLEANEKLNTRLCSTLFGWSADKNFPPDSICSQLLRFLRAFVNQSTERKMKNALNHEFYNIFEYNARGGTAFRPTELWTLLHKDFEAHHGVLHPERVVDLECNHATGLNVKRGEMLEKKHKGLFLNPKPLASVLLLSGYQKGDLARILKRASEKFSIGKLIQFHLGPFLSSVTIDFVEGQVREGEKIVECNWPTIEANFKFVESPLPAVEPVKTREAEIRESMVPSDLVKQPDSSEPGKTKAQLKAEEGTMVPLFIGAAVILGFVMFR